MDISRTNRHKRRFYCVNNFESRGCYRRSNREAQNPAPALPARLTRSDEWNLQSQFILVVQWLDEDRLQESGEEGRHVPYR